MLVAGISLALAATPASAEDLPLRLTELLEEPDAGPGLPGRIAALGPGVAPHVLARLAGGTPHEEVLLGALEHLGPGPVVPAVRAGLAAPAPTTAWRVASLRALGRVGDPKHVELAVDLAEADGVEVQTLRRSLVEILTRHPEGVTTVSRLAMGLGPPRVDALVRALGRVPAGRGLEGLVDVLEARPEVPVVVLGEITRAARGRAGPAPPRALERVRLRLDANDPAVVREAALAAGALGDFEAIEALIGLLARRERGCDDAARQALRELTGLGLGADRGRWESWLRSERSWYRERAAGLLEDLRPDAPVARVGAAVRELTAHRYRRHQSAAALAELLGSCDGELVEIVGAGLIQLESLRPVPVLVELLDHHDSRTATTAHRVLTALTGRDAPPDSPAWNAFIPAAPR